MDTITRETAVGRVRRQLIALKEEGKSVCQIAAEKGILCRGFGRDSDEDLRWRYAAIIPEAGQLSREDLEQRANAWQLERQNQEGMLLCCDVQYMGNETCRAWDDFSNEELAGFYRQLVGQQVRVTGKISPAVL